jgi:hypothetical protein
VIRELVALGKDVAGPTIRCDAEAVAGELVDRSFKNLTQLRIRLEDLGYSFERRDEALVEANSSDLSALHAAESTIGLLPMVVRKWYERIGSVDFTQRETQMFGKDGASCEPVSGLGLRCPLVFLSIPKCLVLKQQLCEEAKSEPDDLIDFTRFFPLGGWGSNSIPKGFWLPSESFDAEFYNDGAGGVSFVEELRTAFTWGGFPFWRTLLLGRKRAYPVRCVPRFDTILPVLTESLFPI